MRSATGEAPAAAGVAMESVISALLSAGPTGATDAAVATACAADESQRDRIRLRVCMHAEHLMYRIPGDRDHLDAAWERLTHLRDNAPREHRASMTQSHPMHRAIADDVAAR